MVPFAQPALSAAEGLRVTSSPTSRSGFPGLPFLDDLRVVDVLGAAVELPVLTGAALRQQTHPLLQREQLLIRASVVLQRVELADEVVARELLLDLGRGDCLPLVGLDLLRHALERLEGALVRH